MRPSPQPRSRTRGRFPARATAATAHAAARSSIGRSAGTDAQISSWYEAVMATRAAAYVRVSPGDDAWRSNASEQRRLLVDHIAERGWSLTQVYEDDGPVTKLRDMTGLSAALGDSDAFDRLVVVSVDRIANTARRVHGVLTRLEQGGRGLVSLEEEFDTGEGSGEAVPAIFAALSPTRSAPAVPGDGWRAEPFRRHGYAPATVIDVGVAAGTPVLYEAFPDAYHVLVEPLAEFEPALQALVARNGGEYVL